MPASSHLPSTSRSSSPPRPSPGVTPGRSQPLPDAAWHAICHSTAQQLVCWTAPTAEPPQGLGPTLSLTFSPVPDASAMLKKQQTSEETAQGRKETGKRGSLWIGLSSRVCKGTGTRGHISFTLLYPVMHRTDHCLKLELLYAQTLDGPFFEYKKIRRNLSG